MREVYILFTFLVFSPYRNVLNFKPLTSVMLRSYTLNRKNTFRRSSVGKAHRSDRFVKTIRKSGHRSVVYKEIEGGKHCGPIPAEKQKEKRNFLLRVLEE